MLSILHVCVMKDEMLAKLKVWKFENDKIIMIIKTTIKTTWMSISIKILITMAIMNIIKISLII